MNKKNLKFNIIKDRAEIFKDFTLNLLYYIYNYYLDKETLSDDTDIYNHYCWCYKKVCDEFLKEDIDFATNEELKNYFYSYYYHQFYKINDNIIQNTSLSYYEKFWKSIFDINMKNKNKNVFRVLVEIYNIFDKSINTEKNILELV